MHKKKTIQDHLDDKPDWVVESFKTLANKILALDNARDSVKGNYIGYKLITDNKIPKLFIEVHVQNTKLKLHLRRLDYKNLSQIKIATAPDTHKWTLTKLIDITEKTNLEDIMKLVRQSYDDVL